MYTHTKTHTHSRIQASHMRPDLRLIARKANPVALPVGFSRRELQRLVADMID
ncbi:hypothetical protein [Asticcacaulis sp.]|uniref:hypothetical protein n=1 Tax=Asticcacaulis sp. TaxID=1872648 RepID=UPI003F7C2B45